MKQIFYSAAGIGISLLFWTSAQASDKVCLEYEPVVVILSGKITRHMEYGAPGYGEDPTHDEKEVYWYLDLDRPLCVNGKDEVSPDMESEEDIRELQIVFHKYPTGQWVGHRATITGTLFHSDSGHHHTKVLIKSESITRTAR